MLNDADVVWWIETGVFPRTAPRLIEALEAARVSWLPFDDGATNRPPADACVVFWGSLGAAYDQRVASTWTPGAIGDASRFFCSVYQPHLRAYLANPDVVFTTVKTLVENPRRVIAPLGDAERVFVRPDSPLKPFSGRVVSTGSMTLADLDHGFYYDDDHLPVLVATAKTVGREWRLVVADGMVVAGCEYDSARRGRPGQVTDEARRLAAHVASADWQAAPLYVVDIAEVNGAPRVMELNPFSGADLYECDAAAVVDAATGVAARLWRAR